MACWSSTARLRVRAANPAARALLAEQGLSPPAPFTLRDRAAWIALQQAVELALAEGTLARGGPGHLAGL